MKQVVAILLLGLFCISNTAYAETALQLCEVTRSNPGRSQGWQVAEYTTSHGTSTIWYQQNTAMHIPQNLIRRILINPMDAESVQRLYGIKHPMTEFTIEFKEQLEGPFFRFTENLAGKEIALVVFGELFTVVPIQVPIRTGTLRIIGDYEILDLEEIRDLLRTPL